MKKTEYVGVAMLRILAINAVLWAAVMLAGGLIGWLVWKVIGAVMS